jgi:hypothetical protein
MHKNCHFNPIQRNSTQFNHPLASPNSPSAPAKSTDTKEMRLSRPTTIGGEQFEWL